MSFLHNQNGITSRLIIVMLSLFVAGASFPLSGAPAPGDVEYFGKLENVLIPHMDDMDQVVFKPLRDLSKIKFATALPSGVNVTAGRLFHPPQDKSSILTLLVEPGAAAEAYLYADLNQDDVMSDNERYSLGLSE